MKPMSAQAMSVTDAFDENRPIPASAAAALGYVNQKDDTIEELLHAMHDAAKFADGATKAILEGVLHRHEYATRQEPYGGNRCQCPHCS